MDAATILERQFGITERDEIEVLRAYAYSIGDYKLAQLCSDALR